MPIRLRKEEIVVTASNVPKHKAKNKMMAQMGSKGGKIGGKKRAEGMTREELSAAASAAARARWSGIKPVKSEFKKTSAAETPLQKISAIFEKRMEEMGLTEDEKNAKIAAFAAFVDATVDDSLRAKQPEQPHNLAVQERA